MKYFISLIFIFIGFTVIAQTQNLEEEVQTVKEGEGIITIHQDQGIDFLMETMVKENARQEGVDGYQIQLFSGSGPNGKRQAMEVKTKILEEFPDAKISTTYNPPFWRVRVGNYRHKHEALPLLKDMKEFFPNCYVVKGTVRMENL
ncbi:SPOR domain-containing protein [Carboxylicivirga caseinilyticus]|uniref:SPOR domain-containing protein n=1 Tax=Carboxylicivirga caseinilyticus TaxID=3417572 RepID=UPI003D332A9B|nr:SPOR domain-containing protein [Marinilabiliaceae bacterium A049]